MSDVMQLKYQKDDLVYYSRPSTVSATAWPESTDDFE
jgi:hypothetical protein